MRVRSLQDRVVGLVRDNSACQPDVRAGRREAAEGLVSLAIMASLPQVVEDACSASGYYFSSRTPLWGFGLPLRIRPDFVSRLK